MWMPFDILVIIDEIKKFYRSEKGTFLSLVVLIFVETVLYNYAFSLFSTHLPFKPNFVEYYLILILVSIFIWIFDRHIYINHKKTNIGISQFDLVDINLKDTLPGEVRFTIREELNQYIYARLTGDNRYIDVQRYLQVIILPARFAIDRFHHFSSFKYRFLDFLVYGVIYNEKDNLNMQPHFVFIHDLPLPLFKRMKEHLAQKTQFAFFTDGRPNLSLDKLLHEITYIGLLYTAIKYAHKRLYLQADQLIQDTLSSLNTLYKSDDQSVNFGDLDFLKLEEMLYFIKAKNLHKYANMLFLHKDDIEKAKKYYEQAADILLKRASILKQLQNQDPLTTSHELDHSYIYAIGLLAKENDEEKGKKLLDKIRLKFSKSSNRMLAEALFAERLHHTQAALKLYEKALSQSKQNQYILRRLSSIFFKQGRYKKCYDTITQLYTITKKEVYDDSFFDIRTCTRYIIASAITFHWIRACTSFIALIHFAYHNKIASFSLSTF